MTDTTKKQAEAVNLIKQWYVGEGWTIDQITLEIMSRFGFTKNFVENRIELIDIVLKQAKAQSKKEAALNVISRQAPERQDTGERPQTNRGDPEVESNEILK